MIIIVNFGGQFAHLIARRVREQGVKSELVHPDISKDELLKLNPQAIIFSGSPFSCYEKNAPKIDRKIYDLNLPILGICYGQQLMAHQLGGKVIPHEKKQFGKEAITVQKSKLFSGLNKTQTVWFSHGDRVSKLPGGFRVIAKTTSVAIAAMENRAKNLYAIQFHPEVTHTTNGAQILSNFLFRIAGVQKDWDLKHIKSQIVANLQKEIGQEKVLMAISGGVDSLVAASLIREAAPNKLHLVFIDTGLLRAYDIADLKNVVKKVHFKNFKISQAASVFLKTLKGVTDPEAKRKIIADLYFKILEEEAKKIGNVKFLGQGTIYPDRVESAQTSKHADKIKSHHNVTLPAGLKLQVIEPIADLYKDEVRKLGVLLGIPRGFLWRHPFPGPGLAIRVVGEVTEERLGILKKVDDIFISELKTNDIYNKVGQALAALLPVKSVGVMGDARTYSYIVALRAVDTADFMTADWSKIPQDVLEKISSRIVNEVRGVNRVVYDITQKPPATIEYE
jgi:GMP synthase (glutamine-hydrolysing)